MMRIAPPRLTQAVTVSSVFGIDADTSDVPPSTAPITAAPAIHLLMVPPRDWLPTHRDGAQLTASRSSGVALNASAIRSAVRGSHIRSPRPVAARGEGFPGCAGPPNCRRWGGAHWHSQWSRLVDAGGVATTVVVDGGGLSAGRAHRSRVGDAGAHRGRPVERGGR